MRQQIDGVEPARGPGLQQRRHEVRVSQAGRLQSIDPRLRRLETEEPGRVRDVDGVLLPVLIDESSEGGGNRPLLSIIQDPSLKYLAL